MTTPHQARRGDDVEAWIKRKREEVLDNRFSAVSLYDILDDLLDEYRMHADTGTPLGAPINEGDPASLPRCGHRTPAASQWPGVMLECYLADHFNEGEHRYRVADNAAEPASEHQRGMGTH